MKATAAELINVISAFRKVIKSGEKPVIGASLRTGANSGVYLVPSDDLCRAIKAAQACELLADDSDCEIQGAEDLPLVGLPYEPI